MPSRDGPLCAAGYRPRRQRQGVLSACQQQALPARRFGDFGGAVQQSTYCDNVRQHCETVGRTVHVANLGEPCA